MVCRAWKRLKTTTSDYVVVVGNHSGVSQYRGPTAGTGLFENYRWTMAEEPVEQYDSNVSQIAVTLVW